MKNNIQLNKLSHTVHNNSSELITFHTERLEQDGNKAEEQQSLAISILSILGGFLASLAFIGFLLMAGLYKSHAFLAIFGLLLIIIAIIIPRYSRRIIYDTVSTSFFIIGFCCLLFAIDHLKININLALLSFIIIAVCTIPIARSYILTFLSTLVIIASSLTLLDLNINYFNQYVFISILGLLVSLLFLFEAKLLLLIKQSPAIYYPLRSAAVFAFLIMPFSSIFFYFNNAVFGYETWVASILFIGLIAYLIFKTTIILEIEHRTNRILIAALSILLLLPTVVYPPITAALLIILLSFRVNYRTGFALGIIAFIYYMSRYYYDLNYSLMTKSILLMSSGIIFLLIYVLIHKKLTSHEKI